MHSGRYFQGNELIAIKIKYVMWKVFVSSFLKRGKTHLKANASMKEFKSVYKSVNEKLKHFRNHYVDTTKILIYQRHNDRGQVHPEKWRWIAQTETCHFITYTYW